MLGSRVGLIGSSYKDTQIPTPWIWIDPSDSSTVTLSGSQITQITSKSGSTSGLIFKIPYTFYLSGAPTVGPTLNSGTLNGKNTMSFSGSTFNGLQATTPVTIISSSGNYSGFLVFKQVGTFYNLTFIEYVGSTDSKGYITIHTVNSVSNNRMGIGSASQSGLAYTNDVITYNTWHYMYWEIGTTNGTTWTYKIYVDGLYKNLTVVTGTLGISNKSDILVTIGGPMVIGGTYHSSAPMVGEIAEIIEYKSALSDTDRITVQDYIKAKYRL